jgi:hypothetical protein
MRARRSRRRVGWVVCGRSTGRRDTAARATLTPLAERSPQRTPQHRAQPAALPHMYPRPLGLAGAPLAGYAAGRNETFFFATEACRNAAGAASRRGTGIADSFTYHYTQYRTRCALRMSYDLNSLERFPCMR